MNLKKFQQENLKGELSYERWEEHAQHFINQKFDREKSKEYTDILAKNGVTRSPRIIKRKWFLIAASFLILITAGGYLFSNQYSDSPKELALQYLEKPFASDEYRRGKINIQATRGMAIEAYNNQQYNRAIDYLQTIENQGEAGKKDYFLMGLCLVYQQNPKYKNAIEVFTQVQEIDANYFTDEIQWFLSLCYIMEGDNSKARIFLNEILESKSSRKIEDAQRILEIIK
ncbi:MAG: tol-pal system YbgF family protein [Saprospiraceae bacterium]